MKRSLVVLLILFSFVTIARAQAPDPYHCSAEPWDTRGNAIVVPGSVSYNEHDKLTVIVRDEFNNPIQDADVSIVFLDCTDLCIDTPSGLSGTTDVNGTVILIPSVGGCEICTINIMADGVLIKSYSQVISPDWDGSRADGIVDSDDYDYLTTIYNTTEPCGDYDGDGDVNLTDFSYHSSWADQAANLVPCYPPDPAYCLAEPWDTRGNAIVVPGPVSYNEHDKLTVIVRDEFNNPVQGADVSIVFLDCTDLCIDTPSGLSGTTDVNGIVILIPSVGGCEICTINIMADGVLIKSYSQVISPDWDGSWADGIVDSDDYDYFATIYNTTEPCGDYDGDGNTSLPDMSILYEDWLDQAANLVPCYPPDCYVDPDTLDFGNVTIGDYKDMSFIISNHGGDFLEGIVSESCDYFSLVSGEGAYSLGADDTVIVTVRYEPTVEGTDECTLETGNETCADVFLSGSVGPDPFIQSIIDVGNDQGRQVRIDFLASARDVPGSSTPVLQYETFRRIDPLPPLASAVSSESADNIDTETLIMQARESGMLSSPSGTLLLGWEYTGAVPAHGETYYHVISPTLADSTINGGMHWSVFFVRAATAEPLIYFDSPIDSGYSLDNLAPGAPIGFALEYNTGSGNDLSWEICPDEDFMYFNIYRSTDPEFTPESGDCVLSTDDTGWIDPVTQGWKYSYKITAVDFSGNESDPTSPGIVTGDDGREVPESFILYQNIPNPFNPVTVIHYAVPAGGGKITLTIYNVNGQLVKTLVDGVQTAGSKSVSWSGNDNRGRQVASGVYIYRMTAPGFEEMRKMVLLR